MEGVSDAKACSLNHSLIIPLAPGVACRRVVGYVRACGRDFRDSRIIARNVVIVLPVRLLV